jgi:hypothetical protein
MIPLGAALVTSLRNAPGAGPASNPRRPTAGRRYSRMDYVRRLCRSPASDPVTTVLILPITFEPFDRPRRQILGSRSPGD